MFWMVWRHVLRPFAASFIVSLLRLGEIPYKVDGVENCHFYVCVVLLL